MSKGWQYRHLCDVAQPDDALADPSPLIRSIVSGCVHATPDVCIYLNPIRIRIIYLEDDERRRKLVNSLNALPSGDFVDHSRNINRRIYPLGQGQGPVPVWFC